MIHDRVTHGRSCKLLEGGQLNKGEGGREGMKGEVGREEKYRKNFRENCHKTAWDSL